jgi:thiamine biosynthesis lipoprotein
LSVTASPPTGVHDFEIWTTTGRVVVAEPAALTAAVDIVRTGLREVEQACSRFRADSELMQITRRVGVDASAAAQPVSAMLADLVTTALHAAESSDGLVDPTVGTAMRSLGYDRSLELLPVDGPAVRVVPAVADWHDIRLDGERLELPRGVVLDLGATAKARAADLVASQVTQTLGTGVLVELGGDIATAGAGPLGGWQVEVHDTPEDPACQVTLGDGSGLATSSTARRTWRRGGVRLHHVLDPRTATPAAPVWRSVTAAAATCVEANTATTAAVVLGHRAPTWLSDRGFNARLVDQEHRVVRVGAWPEEVAA